MSSLFVFGDSFTYGMKESETHYEERHEGRLKHCFVNLIGKHYNLNVENYSQPGTSNHIQTAELFKNLITKKIKSNDVILFGITSPSRNPEVLDYRGNHYIDRYLFSYFNTLMQINNYSEYFLRNILVIKLFEDPVVRHHIAATPKQYSQKDIFDYIKNLKPTYFIPFTTVDILLDNFKELPNHLHHENLKLDSNYKRYFQPKGHPSEQGHIKIAEYIINYIDNNFKNFIPLVDPFIYD